MVALVPASASSAPANCSGDAVDEPGKLTPPPGYVPSVQPKWQIETNNLLATLRKEAPDIYGGLWWSEDSEAGPGRPQLAIKSDLPDNSLSEERQQKVMAFASVCNVADGVDLVPVQISESELLNAEGWFKSNFAVPDNFSTKQPMAWYVDIEMNRIVVQAGNEGERTSFQRDLLDAAMSKFGAMLKLTNEQMAQGEAVGCTDYTNFCPCGYTPWAGTSARSASSRA